MSLLLIQLDAEKQAALSALHALELDEQKTHDAEISQIRDAVLHHINSTTDEIIHSFERIDSEDSDDDSPYLVSNGDWYHEPTDLSQVMIMTPIRRMELRNI
jgi:hypothetical protein